jgi:hypothetical protein
MYAPGRFTPGEVAPGIHCTESWMGLRTCTDSVIHIEKSLASAGNRIPAVEPVVRCYTDSLR